MSDLEQDQTVYKVVSNHEEQYSIWPEIARTRWGGARLASQGRKKFVLPILTRFRLTCGRLAFENKWTRLVPTALVAIGSWISGPARPTGARERLFCFPCAGGGATSYYSWRAPLRVRGVDLCCVQLPNRETRLREPPCTFMAELVDGICSGIERYLDMPFPFFGHSMGALICFELSRTLGLKGGPHHRWLFVSGAVPPHRRQLESLHTLATPHFIEAVSLRYNGLPAEVLANKELLELLTPVLRADFKLIENYHYGDGPPLSTKMALSAGETTRWCPPPELKRWSNLTAHPKLFRVTLFNGDHFFLNRQRTALLKKLGKAMSHLGHRSSSHHYVQKPSLDKG